MPLLSSPLGSAVVPPRSRQGAAWAWGLLSALLAVRACYRGIRAPSLWCLNYYQLSWADGFLRRGLLGTLLWPLGCARFEPRLIWGLQFTAMAAFLAVLPWRRRGALAVGLCIYLWIAGPFLFHEVGYPEQWILPAGLAAAALASRGRVWGAGLLLAVAALGHELAVLTALPVCLAIVVALPAARRPRLAPLLLPSALVLVALAAFTRPLPDATLARYAARAALCGHPLGRPNFLGYYQETFAQEFRLYYRSVELAWVVLPLLGALALFWARAVGSGMGSAARATAWAASVAPLGLGLIGADCNRWVFLCLTQTLLLWAALDSGPGPGSVTERPKRLGGAGLRWASGLPLVVLVFTTQLGFFDGFAPRPLSVAALRTFPAYLAQQWERPPHF